MYRFGSVIPRAHVKREIRALIRSFPNKVAILVRRPRQVFSDMGEQRETEYDVVYEGEALIRAGTGTAEGYGLGTVENLSLVGLINGVVNIRQADIVSVNDGRDYEVMFQPDYFAAFTLLQLTQRSQIGQPQTNPRTAY
jgi:hypothetical protein